jgi:hypothetical protein
MIVRIGDRKKLHLDLFYRRVGIPPALAASFFE